MRHYELLVVLSPMLNQDQVSETWDKIKGFITTREADISHEEQWGTRRLAYPIRKGQHRFLEGSYHLTRFATERSFNIELENFLKVDEEVLRCPGNVDSAGRRTCCPSCCGGPGHPACTAPATARWTGRLALASYPS